jgi:purine-nucleoside phosphorylase
MIVLQDQKKVQKSVDYLLERVPEIRAVPPGTGIVLGSGLGEWSGQWKIVGRVPYADIPGFPGSTVLGHAGELVFLRTPQHMLCLMRGRFHLYEGYGPDEVVSGVRVMAALGIKRLILTNAAGALNPLFSAGSLMLITDHINCTGRSPLTGPNVDQWGPRFPDMSAVYCPDLAGSAMQAALDLGIRLEQGVYVGVQGPALETPAETRAYRILGADAVGMSTVLEAVCAHHMGIGVLGLSCLTNKNLPDCMAQTSHEEILEQAKRSTGDLERVVFCFLDRLA